MNKPQRKSKERIIFDNFLEMVWFGLTQPLKVFISRLRRKK